MTKRKDSCAVLQFEIDRARWLGTDEADISSKFSFETMKDRLHHIARTAISDTITNGGTFVFVVSPKKITMVQRTDAEDFDTTSENRP